LRVFITGGCKNGKTGRAEELAQAIQRQDSLRLQREVPLYYVATMVSSNSEDDDRISQHQKNRAGLGFTTVEVTHDIHRLGGQLDRDGVILLDSLTALLLNEMLGTGSTVKPEAPNKVLSDLLALADDFQSIVFVSDYIYSDAQLYDELTRSYRRGLALLDRQMAALSDIVVEACFANYINHKGADALESLQLASVFD